MRKLAFAGSLLMIGALLGSLTMCKKMPTEHGPTISERLDAGWRAYELRDFAEGLSQFRSVIAEKADHGEAHAGSAWCSARLDQPASAQQHAGSALQYGYESPDIYILQAALALADQQPQTALTILQSVSDLESSWVFSHDPDVSYEDAQLIRAYADYSLGHFEAATGILNTLGTGLSLDPNNPATWEFNGITYTAYADVLLAMLNSYSNLIS